MATRQNAALVEESSASAAALADQASQLVEVVSNFRDDGTRESPVELAPAPAAPPRPAKTSTKPADWDEEF